MVPGALLQGTSLCLLGLSRSGAGRALVHQATLPTHPHTCYCLEFSWQRWELGIVTSDEGSEAGGVGDRNGLAQTFLGSAGQSHGEDGSLWPPSPCRVQLAADAPSEECPGGTSTGPLWGHFLNLGGTRGGQASLLGNDVGSSFCALPGFTRGRLGWELARVCRGKCCLVRSSSSADEQQLLKQGRGPGGGWGGRASVSSFEHKHSVSVIGL